MSFISKEEIVKTKWSDPSLCSKVFSERDTVRYEDDCTFPIRRSGPSELNCVRPQERLSRVAKARPSSGATNRLRGTCPTCRGARRAANLCSRLKPT
ncbi:hypothetical protein F2P81_025623 [Scophthalmus maximus]|uniref:Uncharacterized protein n=1 Tax=Scophthalmus maximus TaxID=52904 RepID=A0A6A4RJS2_SCOMX|nr:hypothetical protein F2P81_025623 [Scophthalmus maximus]